MGCTSSKRIQDTVDVYRPAPSSFAVFDIAAIEEPWLKTSDESEAPDNKNSRVPAPLLEKLNDIENDPRTRTWDEVSKDLENLKPKLNATPPIQDSTVNRKVPRKSFSFHTIEELESRPTASSKPAESDEVDSVKPELKKSQSSRIGPRVGYTPEPEPQKVNIQELPKSFRDNIFILRDREERAKEGKPPGFMRWNPLNDFKEICPPNGENSVVVYTTSLGGVRRTYEDCNKVRQLMETHLVVYDQRDVSLHGGFLSELREMLGEGISVPRIFVKGRYIGGVDEVVGLNETGRFSRILNWAKVERGVGRLNCDGCGGVRFVPCLDCGGSCKVVGVGGEKERCGECNENGLVHCPVCM